MLKKPWFAFLLLFSVTTITTLIARVPLAVALAIANPPLKAEHISGTIWNGEIDNAWVDNYPLGNIRISSEFLPFLTGKIAGELETSGGLLDGATRFQVGRRSLRLWEGTFQTHLELLRAQTAFGTPLQGRVDIQVMALELSGRTCRDGALSVATDALQRAVEPFGARGMMLSGDGHCEDGALVLPLSGSGPDGTAEINIRIGGEGYMTEVYITPTDRAVGEVLMQYGFNRNGARYGLIERGALPQ